MYSYRIIDEKSKENRYDSSFDLELYTVVVVMILTGILFYSFGAATANSRSPLCFSLALGTTNSLCFEDLRDLPKQFRDL